MMRPIPGLAERVGARIRELRLDAEMSQRQLADRVGLHRPVMGRIERGLHQTDLHTIARIAHALELDLLTVLAPCLDQEGV
jgi:transcriptional regulator with XRE-family HTH domain